MAISVVEAASLPQLNVPTVRHLPNGLTIVAEQVPVEAVNLSVWLKVGSAVETDDINGMAHFLEHMMFKGTQQLANGEFERLVEQRGAITNAATSQEYTHYYLTSSPRDFGSLAPLQLDVVFNAAIPDRAFEKERPIILEEIRRSEDSPGRRAFLKSMQVALDHLPYRRPVLGTTEIIESLTSHQMRDFHHHWYRPSNMTAVAVGNLPVDELIDIVIEGCDRADGFRPKPDLVSSAGGNGFQFQTGKTAVLSPESAFSSVIRQEHHDPALTQARLMLMWRVPGMEDLNQTYPLDVIASVLGSGRTARLVKELREEKGLIAGISVSNMTYTRQGIFYISVHLPDENVPEVEHIILQHLAQLHAQPITEAELQRIKTQVANRYTFGNETPDNRAGLYGYYHTLAGDLGPAIRYPNHIRSLTASDIQQAAQTYLDPEAYGCVIIRP